MANHARVRAELKNKYNDPERNFKELMQDFKRRVSNCGILQEFKEHQHYESKSVKNRKNLRATKQKLLIESIQSKIKSGDRNINAPVGIIKKVQADLMKDKRDKKKFQKDFKRYEGSF